MSTYLVAIVVGEYDYVEGESEEGIKVRVYTPLGKKEQVQYQSIAKRLKGLRKKTILRNLTYSRANLLWKLA